MKTSYTGHPDLLELQAQADKLLEQIKEDRYNSDGQRVDAQRRLHELWDEMRKLQLQGR